MPTSRALDVTPPVNSATMRAFVHWIRAAAPYVHAFRGRTFVIAFGGEVVADESFLGIVHDLNLLHSLGIKLVVAHGCRPQVEAILKQQAIPSRYAHGVRVTDADSMRHVVDQAVTILKHRKVSGLFTTPKLLEALGEKVNLHEAGIRGVFCGGTTMTPQHVRFLVEEVLENRIGFYPTYGNTLMGLAASVPLLPKLLGLHGTSHSQIRNPQRSCQRN